MHLLNIDLEQISGLILGIALFLAGWYVAKPKDGEARLWTIEDQLRFIREVWWEQQLAPFAPCLPFVPLLLWLSIIYCS